MILNVSYLCHLLCILSDCQIFCFRGVFLQQLLYFYHRAFFPVLVSLLLISSPIASLIVTFTSPGYLWSCSPLLLICGAMKACTTKSTAGSSGGGVFLAFFAYQRVGRLYVGMVPTRPLSLNKCNGSKLSNLAAISPFRNTTWPTSV